MPLIKPRRVSTAKRRTIGVCLSICLMLATTEFRRGPNPYPQNEGDWPGVGVIRVFGFMRGDRGERQLIWSQRRVNQGAVVFVGDSNISGWTTLKDDFAPLRVANSGVGGDLSRALLFRLKQDVIDFNPRAVVILIGSNDIVAGEELSLLMSNVTSVLRMLRDYNPSLPIVLCKLPPRGNPKDFASRKDVLEFNARLDSLAESDSKLVLLDLYRLLALPDGSIDPQNFREDMIHISLTGYRKFHDALTPIFSQLQVE